MIRTFGMTVLAAMALGMAPAAAAAQPRAFDAARAQHVESAPSALAPDAAPRDRAQEIVLLGLAAAAFGAAIGFLWQALDQLLARRGAVLREMQSFGDVFVRDFERPLVIAGVRDRPIRARVRCAPWRRRLDILLAPADGRRYPNLDDHRHNVEYDVDRIAHRLRHHSFVRKPLRRQGRWVVIPFQFDPGPKSGAVV